MTSILHLSIGFALSFIGSLPLGMINLTVCEITLRKGLLAALVFAAGASLIELLQAFVAIKFSGLIVLYPIIERVIQIGAVPVFLVFGLYFLLRKTAPFSPTENAELNTSDFFKGMAISSLNMLAIPYWLFYGSYLSADGWLLTFADLMWLVTGVMLGTFVLLYLYARLSLKIVSHIQRVNQVTNKTIGLIFILFGLYQLYRIQLF